MLELKFDWDKIKKKNTEGKLKIDELILLILNEGKVSGKTKLQKEVFLAWKEIIKDHLVDPLFHPDYYGPYSDLIEDAIEQLKLEGYIKTAAIGEGHATYFITEKGKKKVREILENKKFISKFMQILKEKKIDWDEWSSKGILIYVYRKYPEYTTKTRVPELKW
jgi:uncharacterized protein YwgA